MNLFAYGTLQLDSIMEAVVGRRFAGVPARLPGYRCRRVRDRTYPGIVPDPGETTEGIAFSGIDDEALRVLDVFEGSLYERLHLVLEDGTSAWSYVIAPGNRSLLSDEPWEAGAFAREHGDWFLERCKRLREAGVE